MYYKNFAKQIIELKNADFALRNKLIENKQLSKGYHPKMKALHNKNAYVLNSIINQIGYPTPLKVGKKASEAAWILIQHAIEQPVFIKNCLKLLEIEATKNKIYSKNLAYLSDRIAVFENRLQLYGTQFDWDANGIMNPYKIDCLIKVNKRRKDIGLNSMEEQTILIQNRVKQENQIPPKNFFERKIEIENWKKQVGWI